jgi:anti-sigma regulatory factor (Ser/Thr protein kinase)
MGRLRTLLLANAEMPPADLTALLDRFCLRTGTMATGQLIALDPLTGRAVLANAGHPPCAVVSADGSAALLATPPGRPLGVGPGPFPATSFSLPPGASLVLFTDGLVERRGEAIDDGLARLLAVLDGGVLDRGDGAVPLADELDHEGRADDVAVLVARAATPGALLDVTLPATTANVRRARQALDRWLSARDVPLERAEDVLLAAGEALANVARHAYGDGPTGAVVLRAELVEGRARVTVHDAGRWSANEERGDGRGLDILRGFGATVRRDGGGTTVELELPA